MQIILDFDYTIFDTEKMRRKIIDALREFGVTEEQYREVEQELKDAGELYTLESHMNHVAGEDTEKYEKMLVAAQHVVARCGDCVYPDAVTFLQRERARGTRLTLLTFGNPEWQQQKINGSGIAPYLDEIIATDQPKQQIIPHLKLESRNDILFISDRAEEITICASMIPNATTIHLTRPDTPYAGTVAEHATYQFTNLHQLNF